MKWAWAVTHRKGIRLKDKLFQTEEEAKEFAARLRRNKENFVLYRFRKESFLEKALSARIQWMWLDANMLLVIAVLLATALTIDAILGGI